MARMRAAEGGEGGVGMDGNGAATADGRVTVWRCVDAVAGAEEEEGEAGGGEEGNSCGIVFQQVYLRVRAGA